MTASTLDASMVRLEGIKVNKHKYNKNKIAEAEALAAEALRMANEAKLAAARLAEVKKTLSLFSKKLENVEQTVQKELKPKPIVIISIKKEPAVEGEAPAIEEEPIQEESTAEEPTEETPAEKPVEDEPSETPVDVEDVEKESAEPVEKEDATDDEEVIEDSSSVENAPVAVVEEESKPEPIENASVVEKKQESGVVSQNLVGNDVVKVVETGNQKASRDAVQQIATTTLEPEATENDFDVVEPAEVKELVPAVEQPTQVPAPVVEQPTQTQTPVVEQPTQTPAPATITETQGAVRAAPAPVAITPPVQQYVVPEAQVVVQDYDKDVIEGFLDSLGIDMMCGVDDTTLGFADRPVLPPPPPPTPSPPFENPTRIELKNSVDPNDVVHSVSLKEKMAVIQRKERNLAPRTFQRASVNEDFVDPFGVDHDDLVFCGKLADLCEPPEFDDDYYYDVPQQNFALQSEYNNRKSVSFQSH